MMFSHKNTTTKSTEKAIGLLYDRYAPWLLGVCLRYTGNRENAEDVLQEGFIKIILAYEKFKPTGNFESWMRRIMVNTALNYIRDHEKEKLFIDLEPAMEVLHDPEDYDNDDYTQDQLMELISTLPVGYRMVFNLYVLEDYSHKEIAEMLRISENTSRSQLLKARSLLRKRLFELKKEIKYAKASTPGR
jgi:RNA polymerase sigma factor (sigma-70 family)